VHDARQAVEAGLDDLARGPSVGIGDKADPAGIKLALRSRPTRR
jgi:hypothetical protein